MTDQQTVPNLSAAEPVGWAIVDSTMHQGFPVMKWAHRTGAVHLHWEVPGSPRAVGVTFDTHAEDDTGAAHVLEHWIGAGSVSYPMSSQLLSVRDRTSSNFLNGFTESGRTSISFTCSSAADQSAILDVVLDAAYRPLLRDREFAREGCRAVSEAGASTTRSGWTGVVFNEMALKPEALSQWVLRLLARTRNPGGHEQFRHEGVERALTRATPEDVREFHQKHYRPSRSLSFAVGPVPLDVLSKLGDAHSERAHESGGPTTSGRSVPVLYAPPHVAHVDWIARLLSWRSAEPGSWLAAWWLYDRLRGRLEPQSKSQVICPPTRIGDDVIVAVARPTGRPEPRMMTMVDELLNHTTETSFDQGQTATSTLLKRFSEPYRTLPASVSWGLTMSAVSRAGLDALAVLRSESAIAPERPRSETLILDSPVSVDTQLASPTTERIDRDRRLWLSKPPSRDASCLPLTRPPSQSASVASPNLSSKVTYVSQGPPGVLVQLSIPVGVDTCGSLRPLVGWLSSRQGTSLHLASPSFRPRLRDGVAVVDLFYRNWTPESWQSMLDRARDDLDTVSGQSEWKQALGRLVDAASAQLLTAPQGLAESAAFAQVTPAGAAHDALNGLPAMAKWSRLLKHEQAASEVIDGLSVLSKARVNVVAIGPAAVSAAEELAARLPDRDPDMATVLCEPVEVRAGVDRDRFAHAAAWSVPGAPAVVAVLAHDLHRRYVHPRLREEGGAYGVRSWYDRFRGGVCIWTHADPVGAARRQELLELPGQFRAPTPDDLMTARMMAAKANAGLFQHDSDAWLESALFSRSPITVEDIAAVTADDLVVLADEYLPKRLGYAITLA